MSQVKNIRSTNTLARGNPYHALHNSPLNVNYLQIFESTVDVFIYKEEQNLKSEKFKTEVLKGILAGYDGHTIYKVFIQEQDKTILIKELQIFKDISKKASIALSNFEEN